jgi:hypothetical protein
MKTLIAAVIFAIALIAAPALAQLASNAVTVGGKAIGAEAEATIRLQLMRGAGRAGF